MQLSKRPVALALALSALLLAMLACSAPFQPDVVITVVAPTAVPATDVPTINPPTPLPTVPVPTTPSEPMLTMNFNGVSFAYPQSLAGNISVEIVPASNGGPAGMLAEIYPAHTQFTLNNYLLAGHFHAPRILVYPVADYVAVNDYAGETVNNLQTVLQTRPTAPESMPFLPIFPAAQLMQSNVAYINFANGQGVRFLTQFSQSFAPVTNNDLFYTFQGLTNDGAYYIAAILPVSHASLPPNFDTAMVGQDQNTFAENYPGYIAGMETTLNALDGASFVPGLPTLDALIQSLTVTQP
jgi:hypothetical protein